MHHRVRGAVLGTIAVLFVPRVAAAQEDPTGTASPTADAAPTAVPAASASPETPMTISEPGFSWHPFGFLRLQYRVVRNDPNVAFVGRDDGFELQNARLGVHGALGRRVKYTFAIDGAVDERQQINVPEGKLRVGLRDAYGDVAVSGSIAVRAGFFETLVDPDLDDDTQREFVDRPIESRGVRATEGYQTPGLPPGRSLGAALRLDPGPDMTGTDGPRIGFELAVQNGADEYASNNDNDTPAASASVFVRLPKRSWVVASARFNRRTDGELPFRRDEDDLQASFGARVAAGPVGFGAGAVVVRTTFPSTGGPVENAYGAHAQILIRVEGRQPLAFGYRFGILDPSSLFLTDRVMEHTVGAVLGVPALHMRLQLQVTHVAEQGARNLTNDRAQIAAELSL
ncbi:MAG: hypothetical protein H0T42_11620 [Deltaproteobacteria bacterium]|nr:hypothetical protein [Deltaproteobacteria bacterium]